MCIDEKKKMLFMIGMEHKWERFIKQVLNINPNNIIVLESYGPFTLQPFDDLMRDIILAVYQENVEEIFVVVSKEDQKNKEDILTTMYENKELQEILKILDYIFENGTPEFPEGNIREWLEGSEAATNDAWNIVNVIRNHPLMPSHVKVTELLIDKEIEKFSEISVF